MVCSIREGFDAGRLDLQPRLRRWRYYIGLTRREIQERVSEHAQDPAEGCCMASRRPVTLAFSAYYERADEAIAAERRIKGKRRIKGSSRAKMEAYIRGDFASLSALARRKNGK